jgi:iron-sulfur cluster assembly accessory protein
LFQPQATPKNASDNFERPEAIRVFGARTHNLRGVDVEIPLGSLTVITGVSGSGKSSLAFNTIYAEGRYRYLSSVSAKSRELLQGVDRPDVDQLVIPSTWREPGFGIFGELVEGVRYQLYFDDRALDGDTVSTFGSVKVVTDKMSTPYLMGASIDFVDTIEKQGFTIDNPNAQGSCACGDSFN